MRRLQLHIILLAGIVLGSPACKRNVYKPSPKSPEIEAPSSSKYMVKYVKMLADQKAPFDLSCPNEELVFTPLGTGSNTWTTMGVTGCGQKATYEFVEGKWIMDSASGGVSG